MPTCDIDAAISVMPKFSAIKPLTIVDELRELLEQNRKEIDSLVALEGELTWDNFVTQFEEIGDRVSRFWSPIRHLHGVADSEELRTAYTEAIAMLTEYNTELAQSDPLFAAFKQLRYNADFESLQPVQKRVIDNTLRDFRLGGIDLDQSKRKHFQDFNTELSQLTTKFSENILDATQAWAKNIKNDSQLVGLPERSLDLAKENAKQRNQSGYTLTLDYPCYDSVMTYCDNRNLRREMYEAYVTRASDRGPQANLFDNSRNIDRILVLRHKLARLLSFSSYAEYSLATKMAPSVASVIEFLEDLARRSAGAAKRDYGQLTAFAIDNLAIDSVEPWDIPYCTEKLRQHAFSFSAEELRPYFPTTRVIEGLFKTVRRLFGIVVEQLYEIDRWHPDVLVYSVRDEAGILRGVFYLDLYSREQKRGGAWMDECIVRRKHNDIVQHPVAYLTCNFTPPVNQNDSLLTHDEVLTLFHEFGHGLHHILTLVDYSSVSGINGVPWDGVELPSQFLENWVWERSALDEVSGHFKTGKPIPDELFERMCAAKNFQAGLHISRQLEFAIFDFRIHAGGSDSQSVQAILDQVREQVSVIEPTLYNRFQHSFSHIFAGGYAAGYYSYKWAEVLAADAFSRFVTEGVFNPNTGKSFRECFLEPGGSEDLMILFERFRGRGPQIDPLLYQAGLSAR